MCLSLGARRRLTPEDAGLSKKIPASAESDYGLGAASAQNELRRAFPAQPGTGNGCGKAVLPTRFLCLPHMEGLLRPCEVPSHACLDKTIVETDPFGAEHIRKEYSGGRLPLAGFFFITHSNFLASNL